MKRSKQEAGRGARLGQWLRGDTMSLGVSDGNAQVKAVRAASRVDIMR